MEKKMHVGQKLYVLESTDFGKFRDIKEVTVSEVGKKYFKVEEFAESKFYIDTLKLVSEYSNVYQCYLTRQEAEDIVEYKKLTNKITSYLNIYSISRLTLEQLRVIDAAISTIALK